ncbi:mucin-22 [Maniola hyperantus]|uniref:mucin-22 n=1 Tax=Aphantopus hyperantus TaxID=2795564 RepID=UPI0015697031|nr:mucin-2 [Maniola hyperantus]
MDRGRAAAALLALAACITCSAAAPTAGNHTALELHDGPVEGCYYNFQHYGEGDRIMTNEPCLNCTCHNRMLMCYLRVCPFTKAIGQDCTVEKRADQCCPIVTCPDVPVDLLTSTSTSSPAEYGATGLGKLDKYGCSIHGKYFPEGAKVPPTPNKPCEHCYCIRNMTTCVMQECTLHVDGCTPIYHKDVCCPVRYSCDHPEDEIPLLDDMTTTVRPTQGFLLTTTTMAPVTQMSQDCIHDDQIFSDGALIKTEKACEHCYCMKGDIVCVVQECGTPMENEGKNCTSLPPRHGQCCPDTYICEGDELVTDSTTEFVELTSSPPRRVSIEGSGYRNEPDEPYTEMSPAITDIEGSGEDFATGSQIDTGENTTPEKEVIDETLLKLTTESNLHLSQSTEPDKGQNTIPDSVIDKETAQEPTQDKATLSGLGSMTTASEEYTTTGISDAYLTSRKDEISTTESVPKEDEKRTTDSTDLLIKTTSTDELILHTNPVIIEPVQKATTSPSTEYTTKVQESSEQEEISTEILDQSSVTEKNKFTDVLQTSPEAEIFIELTTNTITNLFTAESTSINPNINEIDDIVSPASSPSRIPGEGDCLLNGITYTNNTNVPSTNNCHTGCKCISSIIKCDPIICSPPPEYMENMNDCQPVYDTPNSCCPTYVCSVKETIPPESHSHMSGTESPKPIAPNECSGNDCLDNEDKKMPMEPTICTSGNCLSESPTVQKECESNDCKDQAETSQPVPSQDCSNGKCQILPVEPCEGENCKIEPLKDTVFEKDLESTKTPAIQDNCESGDCNDQVTTPSQPSQDCSNGKCELETPCESENCKIQPTKETIYEKDSEPSSHVVPDIDVPTKVCNKENGCDENNVIEPEECVSESCRRKDFAETGEKVPLKCIGTDCKQHDEPTVQSTEQPIDIVTEGSTVSDINLQKTESIESHITTTKEKLTKPDIDVTKQPIYIESTEKLSTIFEQIDTESPTKYYTEKEAIQTDIPLIQTGIEKAEEAATEILQTETPKLSVAETTESLGSVSHIGERLTTEIDISYTKSPEYLETETIPGQNEQLSTKTPHIYTEDGTVLDEDHTKLPQIPLSEIEKSPTEAPELIIPETSGINTEFSETITEKINQKEEFVTKLPEIFRTEKETVHPGATETSFSATEATQTTVSKETISETQTIPENSEGVTEKEVKETKIPESLVTEKEQLQTEVTETITDREDTQTKTPELFATEKEVIVTEASRVTAADKDIIQTESPEIIVAPEPSPTESSEKINTEPQTIQTESPDVAVITKEHTEMEIPKFTEATQTIAPDETITKKDEVPTDIIEIATEKDIIKVSSPDQHDMTIESTTGHESPVEGHTIVNLNPVTNEAESYATKESIFEPQATITAIPEKIGEENKYDESYKPRPTKSEDIPTEDKTEIATEPIESDVSKTVTMAEETYAGVTELITQPTLLEVTSEITTKETYKVTSEEQEMYTKSPQIIGTNAEEKEVTTDKNLLYTSRPDETKSDDVSQAIDKSFTESQVIVTKAPEILTSQYVHISTVHDVIVTESDKESPDTATEPTSLLTNEITNKQEKHTEAPEIHSTILQAEDKTTKLPELYTTLVEELMTPEKSPEKPYETPISELEKDEKYTTDQIYLTTLKSVEELTTTESSKLMTLTPILSTEPQQQQSSTDQKLDSEYPHLTTKTEGSNKEPETSTDILERVTEITKAHPDHPKITEEIEEDLTTKITEPDIVTETYKETTSDNLPSQFTYKDELPTEIQQTISQETSYTKADSEPIVEASTKTILEKEKEQSQETTTITSQITQSSDKDEFESALPFTKTPEPEFVTEKDTVTYTIKGEGKDDTEKDGSEPFISDEKPSDTTEESGLLGVHKPDHTDNDSLTTQTSMPNVADTSKNVQNSEMSTENPESITMLEQNTLDMKDSVTTESHLSYTSSDDKLSTTASDDKEIQEKQESDYSDLKTTSSITELPMSQVTHIDHASSLQTTLTDKGEIAEQPYKTTVELKLEEEKAQTPLFELPKQSTETPDYHITQQEMEVESSSKLTVEDLNNLEVDNAEKTTMSSMEPKTTAIPHQQTDFSKDVSTDRTISDLYNQNTEETPTSDIKEGIIDTQSQKTTTVSLPSEKETNLSHEQETPSTESVAEIVTKSPHETQTVLEENAMTSSILLDEGHIKETMSTEALPTEQHGLVTEYPEKNVDDMPSTLPEKETSESEGLTGTEPTKISIEKESESDTSLYVPVVTELTERPIPVVTEVSQPDITEKDHRRTEIEIKSEEKTTTHVNLDEVTEKDILYTESKPLYTTEAQNIATQQKEINTEALDRATTVPDQVITQSLSTGVPERDESYGTTDSVDKDKTYEHISPQSTTQMPEISSLITETQTKATGMEKTTLTVQTLSEQEEQSLSVTVKEEAESQPEKYNTQSTIENESGITEATADSSKETDKEVPDLHRPTELTPTTLESFYPQAQTTQTHKEFDKSDEPKQTTEPGHEFSETTPFLVELKEHTHQVIDDSSRTPIEEILTTPLYEPQQTERGDQNLDVTDKYEDETLVPITATEYEQEDKEKPHGPEQVEEKISTTTSTVKDYTEHISDTDISPTTSSTYLETGLQEKEKQYITAQDEVLTTSAAPQTTSEKELHTTITTDEKITYPVTETSSISTEKEHLVTDKPLKSETSMGTTLLDEDLLQETSKSTSKIKEESTTHSSLTDKFTQLEEKPIKPTPSPPTQELTKPAFDDEINEGIPSPDFPPSGTGGYGQEPDYIEEDQAFGPGTCRYGGKVYVSAQQIPRDDPCDFCFCFRSDIICLQQSCPPPIHGCHEEPIQGFCCPRYECPVSMATTLNVTTTTTSTTTTLPPHFLPHAYKGAAQRRGCQIKGHTYKVGEVVRASSGPCLVCTCGGDGQMKCDPKACTPEPMLRQMIAAAVSAKRRR